MKDASALFIFIDSQTHRPGVHFRDEIGHGRKDSREVLRGVKREIKVSRVSQAPGALATPETLPGCRGQLAQLLEEHSEAVVNDNGMIGMIVTCWSFSLCVHTTTLQDGCCAYPPFP